MKIEDMTYEQAVSRLEEIVSLLEKKDTPLDESVKLFEEGTELARFCDETLKNAQLRIEELGEEADEETAGLQAQE